MREGVGRKVEWKTKWCAVGLYTLMEALLNYYLDFEVILIVTVAKQWYRARVALNYKLTSLMTN